LTPTKTMRSRERSESSDASTALPVEPTLIADAAEFARVCAGLSGPWIAIDTEFIGERYYQPRLELLQMAVPGAIYLVDVQKVPDLSPLRHAMVNPDMVKIVHSGSQDIELLRRAIGAVPAPVFDTQLAAAFLGHGLQISLTNLGATLLSLKMDGRHTTSDWSARPLTRDQLEYAARDVAWLGVMRDRLYADLESRGRLLWYEEEQASRLADSSECVELPDNECYRKVRNGKPLAPKELACLQLLAQWREETARRVDVPRRQIFPDEGLVELAIQQPKSREELAGLRRVPKGCGMRHSDQVLQVIARASRIPREQWPKPAPSTRQSPPPPGVVELAQGILRTEAERHGVAPALVATTGDLTALVCARQEDRESLDLPLLTGWRREVAGERVLALLQGRLLVRVTQNGLVIAEDKG